MICRQIDPICRQIAKKTFWDFFGNLPQGDVRQNKALYKYFSISITCEEVLFFAEENPICQQIDNKNPKTLFGDLPANRVDLPANQKKSLFGWQNLLNSQQPWGMKKGSQYGSPTLIEYLLTTFNNFQPHFVTKLRSRVAYLVDLFL